MEIEFLLKNMVDLVKMEVKMQHVVFVPKVILFQNSIDNYKVIDNDNDNNNIVAVEKQRLVHVKIRDSIFKIK
jgi:hypothetical protein